MNHHGFFTITMSLLIGLATGGVGYYVGQRTHISPSSSSATTLSIALRKLWADHVIWTRNYIISNLSNLPDISAVTSRLLKNQDDLGQAIVPFYGKEAGTKLTSLLKDHILIAVDVVNAAKAGKQPALKEADDRWHKNAADIAQFLSSANPHWSQQGLTTMLNEHLALTTQEVTSRLNKQWNHDVTTFDKIFDQALSMSDALANGIIKQFPDKFK